MESKSENVVCTVYGITPAVRTSIGGVSMRPQNAIVITNKRIMFLVIPFLGNRIEEFALTASALFVNKISETGNSMIKTMTPDEILKSDKDNLYVNFEDIADIKIGVPFLGFLGSNKIKIYTKAGKKYSYLVYFRKDLENLKSALSNFISK